MGLALWHPPCHYVTVREAARMIPQGAFLAKIDLKAAYRKVPVHPEDQYRLGISWKDQIFCTRSFFSV